MIISLSFFKCTDAGVHGVEEIGNTFPELLDGIPSTLLVENFTDTQQAFTMLH